MARLHLRPLDVAEQQTLATKLADKSLPVRKYQRYRIIAEAGSGRVAAAIADRVGCHLNIVYHWLHRSNTSGFATFEAVTNWQAGAHQCPLAKFAKYQVGGALAGPLLH